MGMGVSKEEQDQIEIFVDAAKTGNLDKVKSLLHELNGKTESGDTALHLSASQGHIDIVMLIIDQGRALEKDARDTEEATPLMLAAGNGHFEIVHQLIKSGSNPNLTDRLGWTAIHHAAAGGHATLVSYLIGKSKVNSFLIKDSAGCSPLWLAAHKGDPETVRILLLQGSNPDEINEEDVSVFDAARESEVNDDGEEGQRDADIIMDMLVAASEIWSEHRTKSEMFVSAEDQENDGLEPRKANVLDGTMEDGPSYPIADEGKPFLNDDDQVVKEDTFDEQIRTNVIAALRLNDKFVETFHEVKM